MFSFCSHFWHVTQRVLVNLCGVLQVCRKMDGICCTILNSTFQRLQTQMLQRFQSTKAKMPRRESARRNHPLACESDIIETLHMRLTLLQMTFGKHIERKHCCFFAGEVGLACTAGRVTSRDIYWTVILLGCILDNLGL
jgi:hypothetical protein